MAVERGDEVTFEMGEEAMTIAPVRAPGLFQKYAGKFRVGRSHTPSETDTFIRKLRGPR